VLLAEINWNTLFNAMVPVILGYMAYRLQVAEMLVKAAAAKVETKADEVATKADAVAVKAEEVKTTLATTTAANDAKLTELKATTDATHAAINSGLGVQLRLHAQVSRRLAQLSGLPADQTVAEAAEKAAAEHERQQAATAKLAPGGS
jgi:hypothetical protein